MKKEIIGMNIFDQRCSIVHSQAHQDLLDSSAKLTKSVKWSFYSMVIGEGLSLCLSLILYLHAR